MTETELGGPQRGFVSTLWTTVLRARDVEAPDRREALDRLIRTYWKPAYFFVRRRGFSIEASKDIIQGFFADFLDRDYLQYVDPARGRFRIFLLTTLRHYLADEAARARTRKRGGGVYTWRLDFADAERNLSEELAAEGTPEETFRIAWALETLERALQRVREELSAAGREQEFETLRIFLSADRKDAPSYEEIAVMLGVRASDVRNRIHRVRRRYREAILEEVRASTESEEEAQEELRDLFSAFSKKAP